MLVKACVSAHAIDSAQTTFSSHFDNLIQGAHLLKSCFAPHPHSQLIALFCALIESYILVKAVHSHTHSIIIFLSSL